MKLRVILLFALFQSFQSPALGQDMCPAAGSPTEARAKAERLRSAANDIEAMANDLKSAADDLNRDLDRLAARTAVSHATIMVDGACSQLADVKVASRAGAAGAPVAAGCVAWNAARHGTEGIGKVLDGDYTGAGASALKAVPGGTSAAAVVNGVKTSAAAVQAADDAAKGHTLKAIGGSLKSGKGVLESIYKYATPDILDAGTKNTALTIAKSLGVTGAVLSTAGELYELNSDFTASAQEARGHKEQLRNMASTLLARAKTLRDEADGHDRAAGCSDRAIDAELDALLADSSASTSTQRPRLSQSHVLGEVRNAAASWRSDQAIADQQRASQQAQAAMALWQAQQDVNRVVATQNQALTNQGSSDVYDGRILIIDDPRCGPGGNSETCAAAIADARANPNHPIAGYAPKDIQPNTPPQSSNGAPCRECASMKGQ